jgi:hypothetical protein
VLQAWRRDHWQEALVDPSVQLTTRRARSHELHRMNNVRKNDVDGVVGEVYEAHDGSFEPIPREFDGRQVAIGPSLRPLHCRCY